MLTSEDVKLRLKALIILAATTVVLLITGGVIMYTSSCYGFTAGTPIICANAGYFKNKYSMSNGLYLSISFGGIIFAFVCMTVALILGILELVSINKLESNQAEQQCRAIIEKIVRQTFIVTSAGMLGACIPLGYFLSFIFETKWQCTMAMNINWLIIAGAAGLAEALMVSCMIILLVMQANFQQDKVEEQKAPEKKEDDVKGEILNTENDQKVPLLQKQRVEQQNTVPYQQPPQMQAQNKPQQIQMSRFVTQKNQAEPIQATNHDNIPQQKQLRPQRNVTEQVQTLPIRYLPPNNPPHTNKESKIEVKPQSGQTVTHITVNFPNNYPQTPPSIHTSSSKDSLRRRKSIRERRQVIKQSMEEQLSSDSDDYYYKRARKNRKKRFYDEQKDKQGGKRKRKDEVEVDYQREFDKIPSRFKATPSQPKYVVLSPQSMRTFYDFVKNQHGHTQKKTRKFAMSPKQHPQPQLQLPKKKHSPPERKHQSPQSNQQKNLLKPDRYVVSQVKEYSQTPHRITDQILKQQVKERSIYQKLDVGQDESDNSFKKYAPFFRSSNHIIKREDTDDKKSDLDEYFNLLNGSHVGKKDSPSAQHNYRSISNYSSVLNEGSGKMPTERQHHSRINVDQNKIRSNNSKAQKQSNGLIDQIRSKYA